MLEATPLVVDGILYSTGPSGYVFALDAASGNLIWQYQHRVKGNKPTVADNVNRGVAILGERVFFSTIDAYLVALDAKTGRLLWETKWQTCWKDMALPLLLWRLKIRSSVEFQAPNLEFVDSSMPTTQLPENESGDFRLSRDQVS